MIRACCRSLDLHAAGGLRRSVFPKGRIFGSRAFDVRSHLPPLQLPLNPHRFASYQPYQGPPLLNLKIDTVFKEFFGNKQNKKILERFINVILDLKGNKQIEVEEFLDPRKGRTEIGKPITFVDLSVRTKKGERYIIEMQTYNHEGFDKRLLYYLGRDYTEQLVYDRERKGISWGQLPKVHVIAITSYSLLRSKDVVETFSFSPEKSRCNTPLFDQWKVTVIDLTNFRTRSFKKLETEADEWLFLMKSADRLGQEQIEALKKRSIFRTALEHLERISSDPKQRKEYEQRLNELRDEEAILAKKVKEGMQIGQEEEKHRIVREMHKEGIPSSIIAKVTGVSEEEIQQIV